MNVTLLLRRKEFFVTISFRVAAGCRNRRTWSALHMRYEQRKFGWNLLVRKGTLLVWPNQFFVRMSFHVGTLRPKRQALHCLRMPYKQCMFVRNRSVMKGTLLERRKVFLSLSRFALQRGDRSLRRGTASPCATSSASLVKIGR
jgi:hypothetical protein